MTQNSSTADKSYYPFKILTQWLKAMLWKFSE